MRTYAIGVGVDPDELNVQATDDGFGAFPTREKAAARLIGMVDVRMETLRKSKARARRIIRSCTMLKAREVSP